MGVSSRNGDVGVGVKPRGPQCTAVLPLGPGCGPWDTQLPASKYPPVPIIPRSPEPTSVPPVLLQKLPLHILLAGAALRVVGLGKVSFGPLPRPCVLWKGPLTFVRQRILFTPDCEQNSFTSLS